ncbi:DICT sensory domain-containing protein [Tychonema sp. LEGE 07203]|uniref:DICT sensory domain-containing protein n=1 Tax=Tychonema sp. LEGE 07203 TaxID=1828671 RepID=UPI0018823279|nr:DICT sensory domain-containing protein [Tychonema sp. LEGE 07203]MBE9096144.1 GAF domain-containing protein [Tychonema sp. LEGE 07203]
MIVSISLLAELLQALPQLRAQIYFKSSMTALSHAMEDLVLAGSDDEPLVIASFQQERFYRQEAHRYRRIADLSSQVYVLAAPETEFKNSSECHENVAFAPEDALSKEWHLVVLGQHYSTCLICQEKIVPVENGDDREPVLVDQARRFEGIWTFDREVSSKAAELLLDRILKYRPELAEKIDRARTTYNLGKTPKKRRKSATSQAAKPQKSPRKNSRVPNPKLSDAFTKRLVTYLQSGQHKLLKAYSAIAAQERKERLINLITTAMRQSLNPQEIVEVAVQELGTALSASRCLIYRCKAADVSVKIDREFLRLGASSLLNQTWPLQENPLWSDAVARQERVYIQDTAQNSLIVNTKSLGKIVKNWQIVSWLMVPVLYQGRVLGMVEMHQCRSTSPWEEDEIALVEAIATQLGAALIQAETYANLEELNQQLEALDRTRSNLIAITGHELRTPLSTIQVCLESLNSEPDMPQELRKIMLETALGDADRMRKLVQDFLTLSHLESGQVKWNVESLTLQECVDLALSSVRSRGGLDRQLPEIITEVSAELPLVQADGEWLVEVLSKLLDNACKFTTAQGSVTIRAKCNGSAMVEVLVADTGRGIEANSLKVVFDRFYQEEGALRRSAGGTGLGLAICKQIVAGWGGKIWADSPGKDRGSEFHFTIPVV